MNFYSTFVILWIQTIGLYGDDPTWPTFRLFTKSNRRWPKEFHSGDEVPEPFDRHDRTIFIVHGFNPLGIQDLDWMEDMKNAILDKGDYNVVLVDWKQGAGSFDQLVRDEIPFLHRRFRFKRGFEEEIFNLFEGLTRGFQSGFSLYGDAVESSKYTGLQIAGVFRRNDLSPSNALCVGHSLGAHACGFAGKSLNGNLGGIVGLDPAGPGFTRVDSIHRLDARDAGFVQVIHTDTQSGLLGSDLPLGLAESVGDVDFYPNGGGNQPGCQTKDIGCSHERAVMLYITSIRRNCFQAAPCSSSRDAIRGRCRSCPSRGCQSMGWGANPRSARGSYWLRTSSRTPFCL